jgi:flagellum-specific peptidoglycan hydrolase FlgJ
MKNVFFIFSIIILAFLTSCGSKKRTVAASKQSKYVKAPESEHVEKIENKDIRVEKVPMADDLIHNLKKRKPHLSKGTAAYIEEYNDIAIAEMLRYKIPASVTLAQGILESNSGRSRLTVNANNHFGVKCHSSWKGKRIYHDDDTKQECFRKYKHPLRSFRDHSLFLFERKRYADLFDLKLANYKGWARGLKKAGYATDPKYPAKLIRIIEDYELYKYDDFNKKYSGGVTKVSKVAPKKPGTYVVVKKGDTLYSLSKRHNLTIDRLKWLNGLKSNELDIGQELFIEKQ